MVVSAPLAGQSQGTFEAGAFGRYSKFDDTLALDNKGGFGGFLGLFLVKNLAFETEVAHTSTHDTSGTPDVSNTPIRVRLTYHIPLGGYASAIRVGAGYVKNKYGKDVDFNDNGFGGLVGLRWGLNRSLAFQVDGTIDYVPGPDQDRADKYTNLGVQAGLVLLFGNNYDKDKDGVKDKADRCPGTPAGEAVDAAGCSASQRDTDGDGVKDNADKCPNTPAGEAVDAEGCSAGQRDNDHDGVVDNLDKCPDTPAGEAVDHDGCSASQLDSDGDGVMNDADQCPDTPAGEAVDAAGCSASQRDGDADGVSDALDKCPNTPPGTAVDLNGCSKLFMEAGKALVLEGVLFKTGSAAITPQSAAVLDKVADALVSNLGVRAEVGGHTDNVGNPKSNQRLSEKRADAVRAYLIKKGVPADQLTSVGYGQEGPVASNETTDGRAQNRRVELKKIE
jgi:outer membrane protein OmpA-like peptidoglycan-associated protein